MCSVMRWGTISQLLWFAGWVEPKVEALGVFEGEREEVSGLEETYTFRTFVPLSNILINGAPVTWKSWSLSEIALIFSLPQSINIQ